MNRNTCSNKNAFTVPRTKGCRYISLVQYLREMYLRENSEFLLEFILRTLLSMIHGISFCKWQYKEHEKMSRIMLDTDMAKWESAKKTRRQNIRQNIPIRAESGEKF